MLPEAVPDAMAIVGGNDEFRFVNAAWETLFGYVLSPPNKGSVPRPPAMPQAPESVLARLSA